MTATFSRAITLDLDALADGVLLDRALLDAAVLRRRGTATIALTDRRRCDILQIFPGIRSRVDALVYEHGAVTEIGDRVSIDCEPVSPVVMGAIRQARVSVLPGEATLLLPSQEQEVLREIAVLNSPSLRVLTSPAGTMIGPAGLDRSRSIRGVLDQLGVPESELMPVDCRAALELAVHWDGGLDHSGAPNVGLQ